MKQAENWKDIKGYEGLYQISNYGRVKSLDRITNGKPGIIKLVHGKTLHPVRFKQGYLKVNLSKGGIVRRYFVHRLVAEAFIPNPNNYPIINHKDCEPSNNHCINLEWCTHKHNSKHAYENNRLVPPVAITGLTNEQSPCSKKIIQKNFDGILIKEWPSIMEAVRNGFNKGHISSCCQNKLKSHKGYLWSYKM